jgi:cytochrome P450
MPSKLPPGPSYPSLVQGLGFWTRPLAYLEKLRAQYGKRFTLQFPFSPPFVFITEPDQVKQIYQAPPDVLHPGEGARVLQPIVGSNSILLLDGDAHMSQRKLMLPAFHGEKMAALTGLIAEVTERGVSGWAGERELALHPLMQGLTLEIILRAVFGLDEGERLDAVRDRLAKLLAFGDHPLTLFGPPASDRSEAFFRRFGPLRDFFTHRDEVDELLFELIDERRRERAERDDILTMLLEARHEDGSPMSNQELRDELMTLLVAGHETTATTLAWCFERLVGDPAVLARLADEVDAGDDAYVTAAIQETLRRRPVLPNNAPRAVVAPIEVGGWHYEPGVCLVPNAYLMHHDPDLYPDPYAFRPERFLDEAPGTYSWIPFGGGRRRCLGASFAMLEMQIVLPAVLRSYELRATGEGPEVARRRNITVRPGRGSRVAIGARARAAVVA